MTTQYRYRITFSEPNPRPTRTYTRWRNTPGQAMADLGIAGQYYELRPEPSWSPRRVALWFGSCRGFTAHREQRPASKADALEQRSNMEECAR